MKKVLTKKDYHKTVKNKNAIRIIPIHNTLIELGFIEFYQHMTENNSLRLFPELTKTEKTGKFGKQPGKQFSDLVDKALSKNDEPKSFHSLRHTFDNFFKQNNLIDDVFLQLFGHQIPGMAKNRYGEEYSLESLNRLIQTLDYGLDFSHLKNSKLKDSQFTVL
jgi:integrase